ncbi:MAG: hypothetical protein CME70_21375 [Halobacteriovorax sp.]|nr:hypothetical protein [Halobacteriovorax sp.]|tara:strand:- start:132295 stop:133239 length:945 start_codon:yes stop_codon:yes gene_type:complete
MSFLKTILITPILSILAASDFLFNLIFKNENIFLYYHNITSSPSEFEIRHRLSQTKDQLETQLRVLSKFFDWGDPSNPENFNFNGKAKAFLSFDDGYKGTLTEGIEVLKKFNTPSLHFLNMSLILGNEPYWVQVAEEGQRLGKMSYSSPSEAIFSKSGKTWLQEFDADSEWVKACEDGPVFATLDDLKKAEEEPNVFFGNHLYNHFNAASQDSDFLSYLYLENAQHLDRFKSALSYFSYPFGQPDLCYNNDTIRLIEKLGAKRQFTTTCVSNKKRDSYMIHRYMLTEDESSEFKIKYSLLEQKLRGFLFFSSKA